MENNLLKTVGEERYNEIVNDTESRYKNSSAEELTEALDDTADAMERVRKQRAKALHDIKDYAVWFSEERGVFGLSLDIWSKNVRLMEKLTADIRTLSVERKTLRRMRQELVTCTCAIHCPTEEDK